MNGSQSKIAFFGGEPLAVPTLEKLKVTGIIPKLIVCSPDRPAGRGHKLTPPPVKTWALERGIEVWQPEGYKGAYEDVARAKLAPHGNCIYDLFVVVAYNFILPTWLIELPEHKTINVHPSLLPALRGPSPIRTAILEDRRKDVGVSIMLMDEKMDHGPILKQEKVEIEDTDWPIPGPTLDALLAEAGGGLLAKTIPAWLAGGITPNEQAHEQATYTQKFTKEDFALDLDPTKLPNGEAAETALRKICAFSGIGDAYFEYQGQRVKVKQAQISSGNLRLLRVTPAGKPEMDFKQYLQTIA